MRWMEPSRKPREDFVRSRRDDGCDPSFTTALVAFGVLASGDETSLFQVSDDWAWHGSPDP